MKFKDFEYQHLEFEELKKEYQEYLTKLKACDNPESFMQVFKEINTFRGHISSMQTLCSIRHSINTADEFYDQENDYWDKHMPLLQGLEVELATTVLKCPFRNELDIPKTYDLLAQNSMKCFAPSIIEDLQKENALVSKYDKLKASAKIEFKGKTYNLVSIGPIINSDDRKIREEAAHAFNKFYEDHEEEFDDIYDELVKVRDNMAKKLGYENYVPLGYARMNRFDYDEKMVENYRNQVIQEIVPITVELRKRQAKRIGVEKLEVYDIEYKFKSGNPKPNGSLDELVKAAQRMYSQISSDTKEYFDMMVEDELFDLPTRDNKQLGGYCTGIFDYKAPFIFSNSNGTAGDVDTLTHEAGHAFQAYRTMRKVEIPDLCFPTMESAEIDSMSMEFFAHPYSSYFFGQDCEKYHFMHIADALLFLPYGCLVDHFQHEIYHNPNMSKSERKATWRRLEKVYKPDIDYDGFDLLSRGGYWFRQGHIFQQPFYYIDYTLAQVCALQFFIRTLKGDKQAWNDYVKICEVGGTKTFLEIVKMANLKSPFEDGCLHQVAEEMKTELAKYDDINM